MPIPQKPYGPMVEIIDRELTDLGMRLFRYDIPGGSYWMMYSETQQEWVSVELIRPNRKPGYVKPPKKVGLPPRQKPSRELRPRQN